MKRDYQSWAMYHAKQSERYAVGSPSWQYHVACREHYWNLYRLAPEPAWFEKGVIAAGVGFLVGFALFFVFH